MPWPVTEFLLLASRRGQAAQNPYFAPSPQQPRLSLANVSFGPFTWEAANPIQVAWPYSISATSSL